jgi:protein SCO1/2
MKRSAPEIMAVLLALAAVPSLAAPVLPPALQTVGFDQRLNEQLPLDLEFTEETGKVVRLRDYFGDKPVVLVLAYYQCPMLCTQVLNGLSQGLREMPFTMGKEYRVLTVSFDPRDTPESARAKQQVYLRHYGRAADESGWHFLTGRPGAISKLTQAVGFRYTYDVKTNQFGHASGIVLLTPSGKISRYFYDVHYAGRDLRLGLVEASANKIGSPIDQILLFCFHYDPKAGKYGAAVMNLIRVGGVATVLVVGLFLRWIWRQDLRRSRPVDLETAQQGSAR